MAQGKANDDGPGAIFLMLPILTQPYNHLALHLSYSVDTRRGNCATTSVRCAPHFPS